MKRLWILFVLAVVIATQAIQGQGPAQQPQPAPVTAIRAGRLIDPDTGTVSTNQIILVQGTRIRQIGANLAIPVGAKVMHLSNLTVLPGLVDAHNRAECMRFRLPDVIFAEHRSVRIQSK